MRYSIGLHLMKIVHSGTPDIDENNSVGIMKI